MIAFIETLRVPEGMHVGSPLVLRPWQKKIIREVYNPVDSNNVRICRKAILSVAKKNGKTPIVSALGLGHLVGPEAKLNEQIYSGAFDREQAAIVHRYMRQMIYMDEELSDELIVRESQKEIYCPRNGSIFKALSSEVKGKHGMGPAVLIMDELAQFGQDRSFYDTLSQGRGAHLEPLLWIISTQAADDLAVLSQEIDYGLSVESGQVVDPTVRCFLFSTPPEADPYDPENWKLANPALGDFLNLADMQEVARTAQFMPSAENNFRNLRLNQRVGAGAHFITPDLWQGCSSSPELDDEVTWWGGLDLSSKNDLTALVFVSQGLDTVWNVQPYFWTPGDNLLEREKRDKAPYTYWRDHGYLEAKPGKTIDYAWVAAKIGELLGEINIGGIKFDRWRIGDLQRELDKAGIDCWIEGSDWKEGDKGPMPDGLRLVPHGQGFKDMAPAIEVLEDVLKEKQMRHGAHPVLTWCASNARAQQDPAGNRKFDKLKSTGRIDGIVALAMALNGAVSLPVHLPSVYEERGVICL